MRLDTTQNDKSLMVVSYNRGLYKICDARKVSKGQFNTRHSYWMLEHVIDFILKCNPRGIVDPFAGEGDLLTAAAKLGEFTTIGYDIEVGRWTQNDSLVDIPRHKGHIILTNPPYLAKHSAKRKGVLDRVEHYYKKYGRDDLYQIALDVCRNKYRHIVAIVPETIINSGYPLETATSLTILEESPFTDTENPVCVVCFDTKQAMENGPAVYIGAKYAGNLNDINLRRIHPEHSHEIAFNRADGQIGLRAVDMPDPGKPIQFMPRSELNYDFKDIKVSSRLVTCIKIERELDSFVGEITKNANQLLAQLRRDSNDLIFSPFKGNTKTGRRRRRLDYNTARAILEKAIGKTG